MESPEKEVTTKNSFILIIIVVMGIIVSGMVYGMFFYENQPSKAIVDSGATEIFMAVDGASYEPSSFRVRGGEKIRWVVDGTKAQGCTRYLVAPSIGVNKKLDSGKNIIEFQAPSSGIIRFSCSMGMVSGTIAVA